MVPPHDFRMQRGSVSAVCRARARFIPGAILLCILFPQDVHAQGRYDDLLRLADSCTQQKDFAGLEAGVGRNEPNRIRLYYYGFAGADGRLFNLGNLNPEDIQFTMQYDEQAWNDTPQGKSQDSAVKNREKPLKSKATKKRESKAGPLDAPTDQFKTWMDNTGQFRTRAKLAGHTDDKVRLELESGQIILVELNRLSEDDRKYIEEIEEKGDGGGVKPSLPQNAVPLPASALPKLSPAEITVQVRDREGRPVRNAVLNAVNHEFLFRQRHKTDNDGVAVVRGITGTWSFYGTLGWSEAFAQQGQGFAPCLLGKTIDQAKQGIVLQPDVTIPIAIHTKLPDFAEAAETGVYLVESTYGYMLGLDFIGIAKDQQLSVETSKGVKATVGLVARARDNSPGLHYLSQPVSLDHPITVDARPDQMGRLRIEPVDQMGKPAPYHLQIQQFQRSWTWFPWIFDSEPGPHDYYLSPGDYFLIRSLDSMVSGDRYRIGFNPVALQVTAGSSHTMRISPPAQHRVLATAKPAPGFGDFTQVMLDLRDRFGNQITEAWRQGERLSPKASVTATNGRKAHGNLDGGAFVGKLEGTFEPKNEPEYRIEWDFGPHGKGEETGRLFAPKTAGMYSYVRDGFIPQCPLVDREHHEQWALYYERIGKEMEDLIGLPTDYPLGIIQNIMHAGFADEILHGFKTELGIEFTSAPTWRAGSFFHAHETGHGRIHKPPCNFLAIRRYYEAYATVMGYEATARLARAERYVDFLYGRHDFVLKHLHGEAVNDSGKEIEAFQFITYYLRKRYGFAIHRRMVLECQNAFRPVRDLLARRGYSDLEQFATVYSYVAGGENLAWLFRLAGFPVLDERLAAALKAVHEDATSGVRIELAVGTSEAVCDQVSVPIFVRRSPAKGFNDLQVVLSYESGRLTAEKVHKRDVTFPDEYQLQADLRTPGKVAFSLVGNRPISGIGGLAQINFRLKPSVSGHLPISMRSAKSSSGKVALGAGGVTLGASPVITTLPPLGRAVVGGRYKAMLTAQAGQPPYKWQVVELDPPPGLNLSKGGAITGTPSQSGMYFFRVEVRDAAGGTHRRQLSISVSGD